MMSKAKNKKRSGIMTGVLVAAFAVPLIVLAVVYLSDIQRNNFKPSDINVKIEENDEGPQDIAEREMTFSLDDNGSYYAHKQVKVMSSGTADKSELRVKIVPMWYAEDGDTVCGSIGNLSDFRYQKLDEKAKTLTFLNAYDEEILTCKLDDDWQEKWEYNSAFESFIYKDKLKRGETTSILISSVEISPFVYEATEGYELHIDVLADTIQADGSPADVVW